MGRVPIAVALVLVALVFPAAGFAKPRLVLHTAGTAKGQVSIVVPMAHPADPATRVQHVDYRLRAGQRVLARGTSAFRASSVGRSRIEHRLILGSRASRAVRARRGAPFDLLAHWREGGNVPSATVRAAVSLVDSAEPALADTYRSPSAPTGLRVDATPSAETDGTVLLSLIVTQANTVPPGVWLWSAPASVSLTPPGVAQDGTWDAQSAAGVPLSSDPFVTAALLAGGDLQVSWPDTDGTLPGFAGTLAPQS